MNEKIVKIAKDLKDYFINPSHYQKTISIFLCGGSDDKQKSLRDGVRGKITSLRSEFNYKVYYPEDIFMELVLGINKRDLLSLENLLANSVTTVVILLQSPGTIAELGAFANHDSLKHKLIVVIDKKHQKSKSFIRYGPVRYLDKNTDSKVIFQNLEISCVDNIATQIVEKARAIARLSDVKYVLSNPIVSQDFCLALLYVFDPMPEKAIDLIADKISLPVEELQDAISTVKTILMKDKMIYYDKQRLLVTPEGIKTLKSKYSGEKREQDFMAFLAELRLEALNLTLRNNYEKVWG